jgi:hypothetical protein
VSILRFTAILALSLIGTASCVTVIGPDEPGEGSAITGTVLLNHPPSFLGISWEPPACPTWTICADAFDIQNHTIGFEWSESLFFSVGEQTEEVIGSVLLVELEEEVEMWRGCAVYTVLDPGPFEVEVKIFDIDKEGRPISSLLSDGAVSEMRWRTDPLLFPCND